MAYERAKMIRNVKRMKQITKKRRKNMKKKKKKVPDVMA